MKYASFTDRGLALVFDNVILFVVSSVFFLVLAVILGLLFGSAFLESDRLEIIFNILGIVLSWLYFAGLESSAKQGTLGKQALGIAVTDLGGKRISFAKATARFFGKIPSGIILGIGYLMVMFTDKKQALHDTLAGTLVVKSRTQNDSRR